MPFLGNGKRNIRLPLDHSYPLVKQDRIKGLAGIAPTAERVDGFGVGSGLTNPVKSLFVMYPLNHLF